MKISYCLPVVKKKKTDVLKMIKDNKHLYDFFEVWIDYIEDFDQTFLTEITSQLADTLLIVMRRKNLEPLTMNLVIQKQILTHLSTSKSLVDIDISQEDLLFYATHVKLNSKLIVSYHNYQQTPSSFELTHIVKKIKAQNPAILKVATYCQSEHDALRLLQLLVTLKEDNLPFIVLGMGEHGKITRVVGSLWGNKMVFAPINKQEATAPDMLTKHQLEIIFEQFGV